jgi:hypothetical protein
MSTDPHSAVAAAIRRGELIDLASADIPCVDCGGKATVYDHRDYAYPLDVEPVCRSCNSKRGSALNSHLGSGIINFRLSTRMLQRIEWAAASEGVSVSEFVRRAGLEYLERRERDLGWVEVNNNGA